MGLCGGDSHRKERTRRIERLLQKDFHSSKRELKLLLLGTGESGKSTVIKQMRIIYGEGFQEADRKGYTILVYRNILRSFRAMLDAMDVFGISLSDKSLQDPAYQLLDTDPNAYTDIAPHAALFRKLWVDAGIKQAFARGNEYQLSDSTAYFCNAIERIATPGFIPTVDDVLRAREATTGIHEFVFNLQEDVVFRMLDVGGQRSERRKWIHCFENVTSIIFIVACSEYDQALVEQDDMNRMQESIALFEQIIAYPWFRDASFILFLNKRDILHEKIKRSPLKKYFPDYTGAPDNTEQVEKFILEQYLSRKPGTHDVFPHFTMATDTSNIKFVFESVHATILRMHLKTYSLF
eukprot:m.230122 g.230122  ORF g.230122 m.230122 type:complete len:351 (-) comp17922_c0_seq1:123-1175(-)